MPHIMKRCKVTVQFLPKHTGLCLKNYMATHLLERWARSLIILSLTYLFTRVFVN